MDNAACPYVCITSNGAGSCAGVCKPNAKRCTGTDGKTPETCNSLGQWTPGATCPFQCSQGSCTGSCNLGDRRCNGNTQPQTCTSSGSWVNDAACSGVCFGVGRCGDCLPGAKKCSELQP